MPADSEPSDLFRCLIPECECKDNTTFQPHWLEYAVPFVDGKPKSCRRFEIYTTGENAFDGVACNEHIFDRSKEIACSEFVSKTNEERLANLVNLTRYFYQCFILNVQTIFS